MRRCIARPTALVLTAILGVSISGPAQAADHSTLDESVEQLLGSSDGMPTEDEVAQLIDDGPTTKSKAAAKTLAGRRVRIANPAAFGKKPSAPKPAVATTPSARDGRRVAYQKPLPKLRSASLPSRLINSTQTPGKTNPFVDDQPSNRTYANNSAAEIVESGASEDDWITVSGDDGGCTPWRCRLTTHVDWLLLRSSSTEVAYAVEVDGPGSPPANQGIQVGRTAVVNQDYASGYRVGFDLALDGCSSIDVNYTFFDSGNLDDITRTGTNDIRSSVTHPLTANAAADWTDASATAGVEFEFADIDYRWVARSGCNNRVVFHVGARYANLEQDFQSQFSGNGTRNVDTDIQFDGAGVRLGVDLERQTNCCGVMMYGNAAVSFLAGEFQTTYLQTASFDPSEVDTSWNETRVVPILELELGVGWQSPGGRLNMKAAYMVSAWLDAVTTDELISAVHRNNFDSVGETITFDGFVLRSEWSF